MNFPDSDLLSAFSEAIITIDETRCITSAIGDTQGTLGRAASRLVGTSWPEVIAAVAAPQSVDSLYWAVEAIFEGYIPVQFLPPQLPFRLECTSQIIVLPNRQIAVRIRPSQLHVLDPFVFDAIRPSLTSVIGFADVLLKGIGGPLNDIQTEDLNVISRDGQFALDLVEDVRAQYLLPGLIGPIPINVRDLLALGPDDIPRRRLNSQRLILDYDIPDDVIVYSNGAIRWVLIALIRQLTQWVVYQSKILISAQVNADMVELGVVYQPAETTMQASHHVVPAKLSNRRDIKHANQLLNIISSLHMQLSSYGCTAWADPTEHSGASKITLTVPVWNGPATRPA